MPMRLNVGLSKKLGLPDYGSLGASCHVEVELDGSLLRDDLEKFHTHVKTAFIACRQAVHDELARHQSGSGPPQNDEKTNGSAHAGNGTTSGNGRRPSAGQNGPRRSSSRRATVSQVRAIHVIAERTGLDLAAELQHRYHLDRPEDLSITDASQLIDALKAADAAEARR